MGFKDIFFRTKPQAVAAKRKGRMSEELIEAPIDRVKMEMGNFRTAVEEAQDISAPKYENLILFYDNAMKDTQVLTQTRTAYNLILAAPFVLSQNGKDNPELTERLQTPWFESFLLHAFEAELYGYSLVEFGQLIDGQFETCKLFPRRHVNPARKEILVTPGDDKGYPYYDELYQLGLLDVGDPKSLGTLELITREVIWKNFARSDWSAASERFGMPFLFMKTNLDDKTEVNKRALMLSQMGTKGWAIGDLDDEIEIKETTKSDFYQIYEKNARYCDEQISKIINGQTGSADQKAFVGSAEVHERILNEYTDARLRQLTTIVNYELLPFLIYHGYPLKGCKFRFTELDPKQKAEDGGRKSEDGSQKSENGDQRPVEEEGEGEGLAVAKSWFPQFAEKKKLVASVKVKKLLNRFLKRLYDGQKEIDREVWQHNFDSLTEAVEKGFKIDFNNTARQDAALAYQLRDNGKVFAAFKNHKEVNELIGLLTDTEGKIKPWNVFKREALEITETYNVTWLETEYNQAVSSAEMAAKWEGFAENADIYPMLEYRAVMDERTRHDHAILDGTVLPIDHPFWDDHYPPNDWGCRCNVVQTDKAERQPPEEMKPDKSFCQNPGKSGKLFADTNPYTEGLPKDQRQEIEKWVNDK